MRAILIDPTTKTISEVEHNGDYKEIYNLIECSTFEAVSIVNNNTIYVDEEGLLDEEPGPFFQWEAYQPIPGKGLILATDEEGNSIGTTLELDFVRAKVTWPDIEFEGFDPIPEGSKIDHPIFGKMAVVGHTPVFRKRLSMDELYAELERIIGGEEPDETMRER